MTLHQQGPGSQSNYYSQQPPYTYPSGYGLQPEPKHSNGLATAGFVVALVGAVFSIIPIVGTVAWVIAPVGLVLSIVGLALYHSRRSGRGLAVAGALLAVFALIMCIVYTVSFAHAVSTPSTSVPGTVGAARSSASSEATGSYGNQLTAGDLTLTASAPTQVNSELGTQLCSTVTYKNTGSSDQAFNTFDWKFRTPAGVQSLATIAYDGSSALSSGELQPGGTVTGSVCADHAITSASAVIYAPGFGLSHPLTWQ